MNIQLSDQEPVNHDINELATVLLARFGLLPRKKDSRATMSKVLLELTEKKKLAAKLKRPSEAICTVEEMGLYAGISRQTMYDYLNRWKDLNILKKSSIVQGSKVMIGYELNGPTLESAFRKAETRIKNQLDESFKVLEQLQKEIKREKIKKSTGSI